MPNVFATVVVPENLLWWGWGKEATPGTAVAPSLTMPLDKGIPDDKPTMLIDKNLRGSMVEDFNEIVGTEIADLPVSGDVYMDSIGHPLLNLFGGYQSIGSTPTSATTVPLASSAGATSFTVAAIGTIIVGSVLQVGNALISTAPTENVVVTAVAGSVVTFTNTPLRFNHTTNAAVAIVTAPFTHNFSILNGGSPFGEQIDAQPPTHTITYHNNLSPSTLARQYAYWCCSGIDFKLNSEQLFQHDTKGTSIVGTVAGSLPTNTQNGITAVPNWEFAATIGGSAANNLMDATVNWTRGLKPDFMLNGQQAPYVIARLGMAATGKLTFMAVDEAPLNALLAGTQQALQLSMTQGAGAAQLGVKFNFTKAMYEKATPADQGGILGWDVGFRGLGNNTDIGSTGGLGVGTMQLINAVPTY